MLKETFKKFIPPFLLNWYYFSLAFLGAVFYRFPSKKLIIIGITGTKGKSTVVNLTGKILEEAGFKVGWISSATLKIGKKEWLNPFHMTMPGRFFIQKLLREMVKNKCQYCLIEVTSEGILQHRQRFIDFDIAVLTNLAPEHIEAHGSFENYRAAKGKLFQTTKKTHILNTDDENVKYFLNFPAKEKYGFGERPVLNTPNIKYVRAEDIQATTQGTKFSVTRALAKGEDEATASSTNGVKFTLSLLGNFNIYNALAAISIGLSQNITLKICKSALEKIKSIPGRMEIIKEGQLFTVIVDLAHTPDSFEKVFEVVKNFSHNKIISVFGSAGGGRDKWKRPELGKIAAKYSDYIILTNEDSYDEDPLVILNQIESGIKNFKSPIIKILDRREAIRKALSLAEENDTVLVLGKGTEQTMVIGSKKIPWDDRKVVKEEFKKIQKS